MQEEHFELTKIKLKEAKPLIKLFAFDYDGTVYDGCDFKFPEVKKLILLKKSGKEKDAVPADLDTGALEKRINYLFDKIDEAYVNTRLPEKATREDVEKINQFLISVRKEHLA